MNLTHLHLLLNHFPVIGTLGSVSLLAFALWRRSDELKRAALGTLVICALFAIPAYMTGEPAEDGVKGLNGVSKALIEQHEQAAGVALGVLLAVGALALVGLFWFRGRRLMPSWFGAVILTGALVTSGLMGWTANLGGQVRHSEIRADAAMATSIDRDQD